MARAVGQPGNAEFAELLRASQSRLYGYIHSLVRDLNDADDLFQQTTLILWKKFAEFDREASFFSWACGIARFEVVNFLRARGRQRLYFSDELTLQLIEAQAELDDDEAEDRREALAACVDALRERDRDLLVACYYKGPSTIPEVAQRSGRSPHSVYNSLRRIRRALFECIGRRLAQGLRPGGSA
jgi:RNA polymerase sigma-70 factor (ECF subfamily)